MYKHILFLLVGLAIVSCKPEAKDSFTIKAVVDNSANGKLAKLMTLEGRNQVVKDSAIITDGKLSFQGKAESTELYFISVDGYRGNAPFILENTDYKIEMNLDSLYKSKVTGSKENDLFVDYQTFVSGLSDSYRESHKKYQELRASNDSIDPNYMRNVSDSLMEVNKAYDKKFIEDNKDMAIAALLLEQLYNNKRIDEAEAVRLYESFPENIKNTRVGNDLAKLMQVSIGKMAPDFTAPDPDGNMVNLNDVKGKVTIVDFWAAWSRPSRMENPNVLSIYKKYHDKGLEIVSVSLDGAQQQTAPREAWLKAIEEDSMTWHQVCNMKYFEDPIAKDYNVTSVPSIFVLDADGKIVAKNLQGAALEAKIAELLN